MVMTSETTTFITLMHRACRESAKVDVVQTTHIAISCRIETHCAGASIIRTRFGFRFKGTHEASISGSGRTTRGRAVWAKATKENGSKTRVGSGRAR